MATKDTSTPNPTPPDPEQRSNTGATDESRPKESGGPSGPEPTRYGDWERKGRCIDF